MQEVGGSIPPGSTSLRSLRELRLGKPAEVSRSEASEGCRAVARRAKAGFGKQLQYYSPTTAFSRSRNATISFFMATSSPTVQADAARIDIGTARAFSFSACPWTLSAIST